MEIEYLIENKDLILENDEVLGLYTGSYEARDYSDNSIIDFIWKYHEEISEILEKVPEWEENYKKWI